MRKTEVHRGHPVHPLSEGNGIVISVFHITSVVLSQKNPESLFQELCLIRAKRRVSTSHVITTRCQSPPASRPFPPGSRRRERPRPRGFGARGLPAAPPERRRPRGPARPRALRAHGAAGRARSRARGGGASAPGGSAAAPPPALPQSRLRGAARRRPLPPRRAVPRARPRPPRAVPLARPLPPPQSSGPKMAAVSVSGFAAVRPLPLGSRLSQASVSSAGGAAPARAPGAGELRDRWAGELRGLEKGKAR